MRKFTQLAGDATRPAATAKWEGDFMVKIDHVALWSEDIERLAAFYVTYFGARAGERYVNAAKGFTSRFLTFSDGARLELMQTSQLSPVPHLPGAQRMGLTHVALSLGSEAEVDALSARLRADGVPLIDGPRRTGDGYYESVVLDPDGNRIELTA
jgi:lactoylglutathione lyase